MKKENILRDVTNNNNNPTREGRKRSPKHLRDNAKKGWIPKKGKLADKVTRIDSSVQSENLSTISIQSKSSEGITAKKSLEEDDFGQSIQLCLQKILRSERKESPEPYISPIVSKQLGSQKKASSTHCHSPRNTRCIDFLHQHVEFFEVTLDDSSVYERATGRVGIRCRHCALLPVQSRGRLHASFPVKFETIFRHFRYNLCDHFRNSCQSVPPDFTMELRRLWKKVRMRDGKKICTQWAKDHGVVQTENILSFESSAVSENEPEATEDVGLKSLENPDIDQEVFLRIADEIFEALPTHVQSLLSEESSCDGYDMQKDHRNCSDTDPLSPRLLDDFSCGSEKTQATSLPADYESK